MTSQKPYTLRLGITLLLLTGLVALLPGASVWADPGDLDPTFDTDGLATTDLLGGSSDEVNDIAIQNDGKIVVAGSSTTGNANFALARYNTDGSLDTAFGGTMSPPGTQYTDILGSNLNDGANTITLQPDGKIVVAGYANSGTYDMFALARYESNGTLDTSFDSDGIVTTDFGSLGGNNARIHDMVILPGGKIFVAGYAHDGTGNKGALARYNADGSLDTTYDTDGIYLPPTWGTPSLVSESTGLALQADGKIIVAGYMFWPTSGGNDFSAGRLNSDGSVDNTFSIGTPTNILGGNDIATDVAFQADGKVVVVGYADNAGNTDFALVRYNTDGSLDTSFGGTASPAGTQVTDFGAGVDDEARAVAMQTNGKIVVVGYVGHALTDDFALARYNPDGSLDTLFGPVDNGLQLTNFSTNSDDRANAAALQTDGKIVLAGFADNAGPNDFALARYEGDPPISMTKTANAPYLKPGDTLTYTLTFDTGPITATAVITDALPSYLTTYTYTASAGVVLTETVGLDYVWDALVPPGGGTIIIEGVVSPSLMVDASLINTATIAIGEASVEDSVEVIADATPPETMFLETPPVVDTDTTPTFLLSGNDGSGSGMAGYECHVDGGTYMPCPNPYSLAPLSYEYHTFYARAVDNVGHVDTTPISYTWEIIRVPVLEIVKTVDTGGLDEVGLGGMVTYTIAFSNTGTGVASGVVMSDPLPSAIESIGWIEKGSAMMPDHAIHWGPYDVPTDTLYTLSFTATVSSGTLFLGEQVDNTAYITATNAPQPAQATATFMIERKDIFMYLPLIMRNAVPTGSARVPPGR